MATVVNVPRDTRLEDLGEGIAKFLNRMRETRIDKLQQELMGKISEAEDEATAAALLADPHFQDVVADETRFALIDRHLSNAQPGQQTLFGYNEAGEQIPFSIRQGSPVDMQTFSSRGLHPTPEVPFYVTDPSDPEMLPTKVGLFRSRGEAAAEIEERFGLTEANIFNAAEAQMEMQRATQTGQARRAEEELGLSKDRLELAKTNPQSAIGQVMEDWRNGQFGPPDFVEAVLLRDNMLERMTAIIGRTGFDVSDKTREDLLMQGAGVANLSRRGVELINKIIEDPRILSKVGALDRFMESVSAEFSAIGQFAGLRKKPLSKYNFGSFSAQSITFKNAMLDLAIVVMASRGQTDRALSDKDLQLALNMVGMDINNPEAFITNMVNIINTTQEDFNKKWEILQVDPSGGTTLPFEAIHGEFETFELSEMGRRDRLEEELKENYPGLIFPSSSNPTGDR